MAANIEKLKTCFRAVGSFLGNVLTLKFPLWLSIAVFLVCVLFGWLLSCTSRKALNTYEVGSTDYQGHTYLIFRALDNDYKPTVTVMHSPDCMCYYIESVNNGN